MIFLFSIVHLATWLSVFPNRLTGRQNGAGMVTVSLLRSPVSKQLLFNFPPVCAYVPA